MLIVQVFVKVKEKDIEAFTEATLENAKKSVNEPGIARFDVLQNQEEKNQFLLTEVYTNRDAPLEHKKTAHYSKWRETVADMMVEPRYSVKYDNVYPSDISGWRSDQG